MSLSDTLMMMIFWCGIFAALVSIFLAVMSYLLREKQNQLLYCPDKPSDSTTICESPTDRGLQNSENVHIRTADGVTLRGFIMWPSSGRYQDGHMQGTGPTKIQNSNPSANEFGAGSYAAQPLYTIIYFHGNAGNVGHRIPISSLLTSKLSCAVLMMDYRGFGLSDSVPPTEEGLKLDAQACLEYVWNNPRVPQERIFVMGTSLGGAVAIHLASQPMNVRRIAGVIVENTFTSISDITSDIAQPLLKHFSPYCPSLMFCLFHYYVKPLCLQIGWRSIDLIQEVKAPILFLSGLRDELVPPTQMRRLYVKASKAVSHRSLVEFEEGMHNNLPFQNGYTEAIDGFVQNVFRHESELV